MAQNGCRLDLHSVGNIVQSVLHVKTMAHQVPLEEMV